MVATRGVSIWSGFFTSAMKTKIADTLKEEMARQGVSTYRLAKLSNLSTRVITLVLRGETNPTLDTIERLLIPLGLHIEIVKD